MMNSFEKKNHTDLVQIRSIFMLMQSTIIRSPINVRYNGVDRNNNNKSAL